MDPFQFFFGPRRGPQGQQPQQPQQREQDGPGRRSDSGGSGFLVSASGLVVTNDHVIRDASDLRVTVNDRQYKATVKGQDPDTDIALLQIESDDTFSFLSLGNSDSLRVGDWIMVIGSPLGLDHTVTTGVVSAKGRSIGINRDASFENFIQTDAAINFGNSGGPLVNLRGEVVGIATAINYGAENIGFAVPVSTLEQILPQLRDTGRVDRGYLGVNISNLDYRSAQAFGLDEPKGALVERVTEDTPAEKAGLEPGDIILEADGKEIEETRNLIEYVAAKRPETKVNLKVLRDGKRISKVVTLAQRPGNGPAAESDGPEEDAGIEWLGLRYQDLTPAARSQHGISEDVEGVWVVQVSQDSPFFEQGVRPGLLITSVNGKRVSNVREFDEIVRKAGSGSVMRIYVESLGEQGSQGRFVFVPVP